MQETRVPLPGLGRFPWGREWQLNPVFLPGESHGERSLLRYSPRGRRESDTTQRLTRSLSLTFKCYPEWMKLKGALTFQKSIHKIKIYLPGGESRAQKFLKTSSSFCDTGGAEVQSFSGYVSKLEVSSALHSLGTIGGWGSSKDTAPWLQRNSVHQWACIQPCVRFTALCRYFVFLINQSFAETLPVCTRKLLHSGVPRFIAPYRYYVLFCL